jgi:hypothetical protein
MDLLLFTVSIPGICFDAQGVPDLYFSVSFLFLPFPAGRGMENI